MRLIDADELVEEMIRTPVNAYNVAQMIHLAQNAPTVYDADKVMEQLREVSIPEDNILYLDPDKFGVYVRLEDAEKIIKAGLNQ